MTRAPRRALEARDSADIWDMDRATQQKLKWGLTYFSARDSGAVAGRESAPGWRGFGAQTIHGLLDRPWSAVAAKRNADGRIELRYARTIPLVKIR